MKGELADRRKRMREHTFNEHIATLNVFTGPRQILEIVWGKPGTGIDKMNFILDGERLFISGDWGETVYRRHHMSFHLLANSHFGYLREKLEACSEFCGHHLGMMWDDNLAQERVREKFRETWRNKLEAGRKADKEIKQLMIDVRDSILDACESEFFFTAKMVEYRSEMVDIFGDDWYEIFPETTGMVIHPRLIGQAESMKMALEQLESKGIQIPYTS